MGKVTDRLNEGQRRFVAKQSLFFVATAPLSREGHVNLSPKGLDTLVVLDDQTVAYLDFTGSGAETIAHLRENGRITLMFCSFEGAPMILRIYGNGDSVLPASPEFLTLRSQFSKEHGGVRAIIRLHIHRVAESCGYGVPLLSYVGERPQLPAWVARKGEEGAADYQQKKNARSIDGLPALEP